MSVREFGVPVTWLECRAPHSDGCVIRSEADTEDFLSASIVAHRCARLQPWPNPRLTLNIISRVLWLYILFYHYLRFQHMVLLFHPFCMFALF